MGCLLWVHNLNKVSIFFISYCGQYRVILDRDISRAYNNTSRQLCPWFVLCCALLCCAWHQRSSFISFRVTSRAPGQSCDCPGAREVTLKSMGKNMRQIIEERLIQPHENKTKWENWWLYTLTGAHNIIIFYLSFFLSKSSVPDSI